MNEAVLAVLTGVIVGCVFQLFKLPIPAPPVFAGVLGIMGIWAGSSVTRLVMSLM